MSLDAVKEEVSAKAIEFLQSTASNTKKVSHFDVSIASLSTSVCIALASSVIRGWFGKQRNFV